MFNLGQALPLTFVRFSCCAHRRAQLRERVAHRYDSTAIRRASNAHAFANRTTNSGASIFRHDAASALRDMLRGMIRIHCQ